MQILKTIFSSSLFKASGAYTIFSIVNLAIPLFLLPLLTRYLSPADYGIVAMFSLLISIIGVFTGLSVHGAINRVYFEKGIDFKQYVANCIYILFLSTLIVFVIVYLFRNNISILSSVPSDWILIAVIVSFFQFLILSHLAIYQARLKAKEYGLIQIGQAGLNAILTIIFVVLIGMKWEGRLLAQLLAVVVVGIISFILISQHWAKWKSNWYYIFHSLKFGLPLIPHTIGGMLMVITSRFIINHLLGVKEVGIYTAGLQIGMVIGLLADAFNQAWVPWLFGKLNEDKYEIKLKIVKFTYAYFIVILLLALFLGFFAPFIVKTMFGKDFYSAKDVILWIALGYAFNGMYYMVANYIFYIYKTYILTWITLFCGSLNIPITYYMVKLNGVVGAAQSYAIVLLLSFVLTWFLSQKVYSMPWLLNHRYT